MAKSCCGNCYFSHSIFDEDKGVTKGMASCECGNITVDSMGYKDRGRVFEKQPGTAEGVE